MCTRTSKRVLGLIATLACAAASQGQGVTVQANAPATVAPGEAVTIAITADAQPTALITAIGGFALDFEITAGDEHVESIGAPVFSAMSRGARVGPISPTAIQSIVGGQYADIDGSNPSLSTDNPAVLFEVTLQIDASAVVGSTINVSATNPDPAGGVFVYPASSDTILAVPNTASSALTLVPVTIQIDQPCAADVNGDGVVSPADFNAWILAFNTQAPECDQNADGLCTPSDFNAWILNFNQGC